MLGAVRVRCIWAMLCVAIGLAAGALAAPPAFALPAGAVDPGFAGGTVRTLPATSISGGTITVAAPDGSGGIVGAGLALDGDGLSVSVVRRDAAGAPVDAFGGDGEARIALPARAIGIGRQPSGRIIVLTADGVNPSSLVAFTAAGELDETFAPGGKRSLSGTPLPVPVALELDSLGRILLAGDPAGVLRLTAGGAVDPTFGGGGFAPLDLPPDSSVRALAVGAIGDVVVSATLRTQAGFERGTAVAHVTALGSPDPAWGSNGVATVAEQDSELDHDLVVRPDGRVLLADGERVHALTPLGEHDPAFSGDGVVEFGFGPIEDIAVDAAGRLYLARDDDRDGTASEISRYGTGGALDAGFGQVSMPEVGLGGMSLLGETAGVLAVGGAAPLAARPLRGALGVLSRLRDDGTRDPVTGPRGTLVVMGRATSGAGVAIARGAGGRAVLAGWADEDQRRRLLVARVLADGTPDPTFGSDGRVLLDSGSRWLSGVAVALDGDRPVVAASTVDAPTGGVVGSVVARFTPTGAPDETFGPGGMRELAVPGLVNPTPVAIAVDAAGRTVVAGHGTGDGGRLRAFVVRLLAGGSLDPSFSGDGIAVLAPGDGVRGRVSDGAGDGGWRGGRGPRRRARVGQPARVRRAARGRRRGGRGVRRRRLPLPGARHRIVGVRRA